MTPPEAVTELRPRGRIIGTEVEFGISVPEQPLISSIVTSTQVVKSYIDPGLSDQGAGSRWDYDNEAPMRDARGFDLSSARPTRFLDPQEFGVTNRVLTNGARFYVDHAHPEYSAPEVDNPRDAVIYELAGDAIMHRAGRQSAECEDHANVRLYKNNVDGKGASYGAHENYLVRREVDFDELSAALIPHFVSRQVYTGAGRVGIGQKGQIPGFQLSQRADYIEVEIGLETTLRRGIINTRDEPHGDPEQWRRLHVIIGDANMSETALLLKVGATSLILDAIEAGTSFTDLTLADPVDAVHIVSRDLTLTKLLKLADGSRKTAIGIQRAYLDRVRGMHREGNLATQWARQVISEWERILDRLEKDPLECADTLDWPAKLRLLNAYRKRDSLDWDSAQLALIDLQYSDIDPARGLYHRLVDRGSMRTIVSPTEIEYAITNPPATTRAYLRGEYLRRFEDLVVSAGWDVITTTDSAGDLRVIDLTDPYFGTKADCVREPELLGIDGPEIVAPKHYR